MIDTDEGLKDRRELLEELRSLFRYEDQLLQDWYTESEFEETVISVVLELAEVVKSNEWLEAPLETGGRFQVHLKSSLFGELYI